jgi:hypothetical protein
MPMEAFIKELTMNETNEATSIGKTALPARLIRVGYSADTDLRQATEFIKKTDHKRSESILTVALIAYQVRVDWERIAEHSEWAGKDYRLWLENTTENSDLSKSYLYDLMKCIRFFAKGMDTKEWIPMTDDAIQKVDAAIAKYGPTRLRNVFRISKNLTASDFAAITACSLDPENMDALWKGQKKQRSQSSNTTPQKGIIRLEHSAEDDLRIKCDGEASIGFTDEELQDLQLVIETQIQRIIKKRVKKAAAEEKLAKTAEKRRKIALQEERLRTKLGLGVQEDAHLQDVASQKMQTAESVQVAS